MSNTLLVFTYAPAGLGHIRVADALMEGLPGNYDRITFAPFDKSLETIHRFSSLNIFARRFMEWVQHGEPQKLFTRQYRKILKKSSEDIFIQFISLIESQPKKYEKIVVVSTHFGLAYQLGAIKKRLEKELECTIELVVQITDDTPQYIWYVDNADIIVCPSEKTKFELEKYAKSEHLKKVDIAVNAYPVVPAFAEILPEDKLQERENQYDPYKLTQINIVMPVSGAAVGMQFFLHLIDRLHTKSHRLVFYVVCRKAPFTEKFINKIESKKYVKLFVSDNYKDAVSMYNSIYLNNVIAAEITKPSEHTFKALLQKKMVGGSFLFLAEPVGRQEYDNLDFLRRYGYLSQNSEQIRAMTLPHGSKASAELIWKYFKNGELLNIFRQPDRSEKDIETKSKGAITFWKIVLNKNTG